MSCVLFHVLHKASGAEVFVVCPTAAQAAAAGAHHLGILDGDRLRVVILAGLEHQPALMVHQSVMDGTTPVDVAWRKSGDAIEVPLCKD